MLASGCVFDDGPKTGPGLEPPFTTGSPGRGSADQGVSAPTTPVPTAGMGSFGNVGGAAGSPGSGPIGAAGTGAAGGQAPPPAGEPMAPGAGGAAAAGSGGSGGDSDPGSMTDAGGPGVCEAERIPAQSLQQRVIAPPDGGLPGAAVCEYALPATAERYLPDLVNLEHTREGQRESVPRVDDLAACDPLRGGFYYDDAQNPTRIIACPVSCARIVQGGSVEIVLGCPTQTF